MDIISGLPIAIFLSVFILENSINSVMQLNWRRQLFNTALIAACIYHLFFLTNPALQKNNGTVLSPCRLLYLNDNKIMPDEKNNSDYNHFVCHHFTSGFCMHYLFNKQ